MVFDSIKTYVMICVFAFPFITILYFIIASNNKNKKALMGIE